MALSTTAQEIILSERILHAIIDCTLIQIPSCQPDSAATMACCNSSQVCEENSACTVLATLDQTFKEGPSIFP